MSTSLAALLVEDVESDAQLLVRCLQKGGYDLVYEQIETAAEMRAALESRSWDIVISDYKMPQFDGRAALKLLHETGIDIPFIVVSGTIGEETAVAMMKAGAHDYLVKGQLTRLVPAVERELEQAQIMQERRKAEEMLRLNEERFQVLIQNSADLIVVIDREGLIQYASPSSESILGYAPKETIGKNFAEWIHPQDQPLALESLTHRRETPGTAPGIEVRGRHKNGQWRIIEAIGTNLLMEPSVQGIVLNMRDVTERRQAEALLRESEDRYRTLVESSPDSIGIHRDGKVVYVNAATVKLFHAGSPEDLIGMPVLQFVHPDYQTIVLERIRKSYQNRELAAPLEEKFVTLDRQLIDVEVSTTPIVHEGKPSTQIVIRDISERKQAEEATRHRVMELETVNRISLALRAITHQNEMLSIVLDEVLAIINTSHGCIRLYDKAADGLVQAVARGWMSQAMKHPVKIGDGVDGRAFLSEEPYILRDFASEPGWGGACFPIRTTQQTLGVLIVSVPSERELDRNEIRLLSILSEMAGAALQRMQLHDQTVRRLDQLNALRTIDQSISSSRDICATLNILLDQAIHQLNLDAVDVLLLHPGSSRLELTASRGFRMRMVTAVNLEDSLAGRSIMEARPILGATLEAAPIRDMPQVQKIWIDEGFAGYWCMPLIVKGEIKGALEAYRRSAFSPDAEWIEFFEALAGQAAIAIDNAQLFDNLQRANTDLSLAYDATIEGWSHALDLRDHDTEGHTIRVADLTLNLALTMQIDESHLTAIRRGALLHDIGKMAIPDSILLKDAKLTKKEWEIMRKHPQYAREMLTPIAYLRDALDIPYYHHEKWDGTGYPTGLKGKDIPIAARIFAIADVWDAITNDRPYRKAWTKARALKYIREQSGHHFDPQVVEKFLELH